jgi:hypothetical protein
MLAITNKLYYNSTMKHRIHLPRYNMLADDKSLTVYCSFRMEKIFMCDIPRVKETSERENPPPAETGF